jgi:8-oxo-dGTP pyrophosphatase MutT (NUDIX family)
MSESKNPWKIIAEKKVYDNPWIGVVEYDVLNPRGGKGIYGKVHFKKIAVGVLVLDEQLNTYLVGQYRFPLNDYSWEIPEGGAEMSESSLECAKRELKEETGFIAEEWREIIRLHLSNSISDELAIIFLAQKLIMGAAMPEDTEELALKKLPFEEAYQMVEKGLITDSMSVAAIQKIKLMLVNNQLNK